MESWTPLESAKRVEDLRRVVATRLSASAVRVAREQPAECSTDKGALLESTGPQANRLPRMHVLKLVSEQQGLEHGPVAGPALFVAIRYLPLRFAQLDIGAGSHYTDLYIVGDEALGPHVTTPVAKFLEAPYRALHCPRAVLQVSALVVYSSEFASVLRIVNGNPVHFPEPQEVLLPD